MVRIEVTYKVSTYSESFTFSLYFDTFEKFTFVVNNNCVFTKRIETSFINLQVFLKFL